MTKTAVVLFNLGGPDRPEAVKPFLFNLFNDPAIIGAPKFIRYCIAKLISSRRAPVAQAIYHELGGGSPILPLTEKQAKALETELGQGYKVFISMRYWHPMSAETVEKVKEYQPDNIVLLPLYPQFSTTTTGSSVADWKRYNLPVPTRVIGCYPIENHFIDAHVESLKPYLVHDTIRILFSAHGLPKKVIEAGDPYQWQVEQTAARILEKLPVKNIDYQVCYQSKVGPLEWIGPSTEAEILRAGKEGKSVVIVPIAFVSEHSETLVELDIEYKKLAEENGVKGYYRVPALGEHPLFIKGLAKLCRDKEIEKPICPAEFGKCGCNSL